MNRIWKRLVLVLSMAPLASATDPLSVSVFVSPKPYFAGQGIQVTVSVDRGTGSASIEPPRVKDAEIFPLPTDPSQPSTNRFMVVPGHAGPLDLPSFRVRSGDRSGTSKPTRLVIGGIPAEGRSSAFLGGVGAFEVKAEAQHLSVRTGETLEFRVSITGPAAWGSVRTPDLNGWKSPTLKVETRDDQLQASEPPVRTFRYRVRPLKSGRVVLAPVAIAAFDPRTRRYATKVTSSLTIEVKDPARFDPSRLDYPPVSTTPTGPLPRSVVLVVGGSLAVVSGAAWLVARRRRKPRATDLRRLALDLSNELQAGVDEIEPARAVAEALTTFLHRAAGRSPGVLTPPEARAGFERLTVDPTLASFAEALVTRCDRARYGVGGSEGGELIAEGRRFFAELARARGVDGRKGGGPGEAAETASVT